MQNYIYNENSHPAGISFSKYLYRPLSPKIQKYK